ncbi:MAG: prolyl oligopeptidase family serine peptidase [bacterium]|nr:prolyl oligopeptidase family serine peptidase [bacterium]
MRRFIHTPTARSASLLLLVLWAGHLAAQTMSTYRQPPDPIPAILDAPPPPVLSLSGDQARAVEMTRRGLPSVAELAAPAVETAGLRINPATGARMDQVFVNRMALIELASLEWRDLELPEDLRAFGLRWSPDSRRLAWCRATDEGTELWVTDTADGRSRLLGDLRVNAAMAQPVVWRPDGAGLVCLRIPPGRGAPPAPMPPEGPEILANEGRAAPSRTFPYLIRSAHDERLFEYHAAAELVEVDLAGRVQLLMDAAIMTDFDLSPDGRFLLVERLHGPWSRSQPWWDFPQETLILDHGGHPLHVVARLPLADEVPIRFGSVRPGPRGVHWRADEPATLCWVEALDGGDARRDAAVRDALYLLEAPFEGAPRELCRLKDRFAGLAWGRADMALMWESWYQDRRERVWRLDPRSGRRTLLLERNSEDAWTEPGRPQMVRSSQGRSVLRFSPDGRHIYWSGRGVGPEGVRPYLDRMTLRDGARERIWQCRDPWYESLQAMLDDKGDRLLVSRESRDTPENTWLLERPARGAKRPRESGDYQARQLTRHEDPAPVLAGLQKEILRYQRSDGVDLSATLYLPPGYRRGVDPPLPALFWVYPREFKSREAAGRVTSSEFTFSRPAGISVLFLLTQGYAVVADPTLPILGEEGAKANDTYLEQLAAGARAAVEHVASLGVIDTSRLAIGGHSYGAFTAANLLAHTGLFRTALCRSGAYNRTLTPFGFQGEDRNLWEAPETYLAMSPFLAADRITRPILLVHGMEDPNSGTYPMQSDRFYDALKGLGATVRLVRLPAEGHDYRARETVGHVHWETIAWCDRYLKGVIDAGDGDASAARPGD